jgi:hypothetical protein
MLGQRNLNAPALRVCNFRPSHGVYILCNDYGPPVRASLAVWGAGCAPSQAPQQPAATARVDQVLLVHLRRCDRGSDALGWEQVAERSEPVPADSETVIREMEALLIHGYQWCFRLVTVRRHVMGTQEPSLEGVPPGTASLTGEELTLRSATAVGAATLATANVLRIPWGCCTRATSRRSCAQPTPPPARDQAESRTHGGTRVRTFDPVAVGMPRSRIKTVAWTGRAAGRSPCSASGTSAESHSSSSVRRSCG